MKRYILLLTFCLSIQQIQAQITLDSTILDSSLVITGLDIPWEMLWGPDDWLWVTERYGRLSRIDPENGTMDTILDLSSEIYQTSESGLLGMALHPDFANNPYVFLAYNYLDSFDILERIVRYEYNGTILHNPNILIDGILGHANHNGCRIIFLPDTSLLITTGDARNTATPQDLNSLNGKTLRIYPDGSIPMDNPIAGSPLWSWGHRNAQGLWRSPDGIVYSSEHGTQNDDELNIIEKGRNYGWPDVEGYCDQPFEMQFCIDSNVREPLTIWSPTLAPSDIVWYDHPAIPEFQNTILMTVLKDKRLVEFDFSADGLQVTNETHHFIDYWGRLRDICVAPDGSIYIATNGPDWSNPDPFTHSIIKLKNNNYTNTTKRTSSTSFVKIQPNPSSGIARLQFSTNFLGGIYSLTDGLGRRLRQASINQQQEQLEASDLPSGIYYLLARKGEQQIMQKLVIK